jgi:hypothetical protein
MATAFRRGLATVAGNFLKEREVHSKAADCKFASF